MFRYLQITNDNLSLATKIQIEIFPKESAYKHYLYVV